MPSLAPPIPTPTPDELDDLIYFSRTGDFLSLRDLLDLLCKTHSCAPSVILASAIDIDSDGLGSQSCLLHYPAANGNLEIITYLLGLIVPVTTAIAAQTTQGQDIQEVVVGVVDKSAPQLVNHRNVSGNTPLHWAAINGHLEVVKELVKYGADPTVVNEAGRDVLVESECSSKEGARECADWLLANCAGLERGIGGERHEEEGDMIEEGVSSSNSNEEAVVERNHEEGRSGVGVGTGGISTEINGKGKESNGT